FRKLFFILLVFYSAGSISQQIPTINLFVKDGMSSNYVVDMAQDKNGFMWFATRHGVNRFDGDKFTVYVKGTDQTTLNSNDINRIVADTFNNQVWISNRWDGINVYKSTTGSFFSFLCDEKDDRTLSSNEVRDILVTSTGEVWAATARGLDLYDPDKEVFIRYSHSIFPELPSNHMNVLSEGHKGEIYIGHYQEGLTVFSPADKSIRNFRNIPGDKNSLPGNTVYAVLVGADSRVWIATDGGLSLFDPVTETFRNFRDVAGIHHSIKGVVFCVSQSGDGRIWAGTWSDLCYFDIKYTDKILSGQMDVSHMYIQDLHWGDIQSLCFLCTGGLFP
ncbi:MAG: hypothetical protein LUE93_14845, partial [Bacteroides sp.]|nr:hypothetical protein [Bacteroides sp.]